MSPLVSVSLPGLTRAEALVDHVQQLILDRGLQPGELIGTKAEVRESVNVARATMNEAVRLLEAKGIVTARPGPGGGLFVAPHDPMVRLGQSLLTVRAAPVSVADAVIVRELLDTRIILDATRHRTADDIVELTECNNALAGVVDDPDAFLHAVWELHRAIARITPNRILRETYLSMLNYIEAETAAVGSDAGAAAHRKYKRSRLRLHQRITRAIVAGDEDAAAAVAAEHALTAG